MENKNRYYIACDLKSYYSSVECIERGLDPLNTNLVVADESRTEKTICLAVSPSLKQYGIPGRARLFEVIQKIKNVNNRRSYKACNHTLTGESHLDDELKNNPNLAVSYIVAPPRMSYYIKYSTKIYEVYLKHVAPEDIFAYSIDEVFIDATGYLASSKLSVRAFAEKIITDVYKTTGITATIGIGTNMYLAKIAMDIVAKHMSPDKNGVRIAVLDELTYRKLLWSHRPLTDFWRVGKGYAKRLEANGLYTMGDIARCSIGKTTDFYNEDLLYKLFGVNAELLIDHAWGYEPCTMKAVKEYKPQSKCLSSGQVLSKPYSFKSAKIIVKEMLDLLALDLVEKQLVTDQIVVIINYDIENLEQDKNYTGQIKKDFYGRNAPKPARITANIKRRTSSSKMITDAVMKLYDKVVDKNLTVRRVNITANHLINENEVEKEKQAVQLDFFTDYKAIAEKQEKENNSLNREKNMQKAILKIKHKYGKNSIIKGLSLGEDATTLKRNKEIGGHRA